MTTDWPLAILRSSGERSQEVAELALREALPDSQIEVVSVAPLRRSLDVTLQEAAERAAEFMIVCDADVIASPTCLRQALDDAERMPSSYLQLTVHVSDWLFGRTRPGGIRVYRTSHAATARAVLSNIDDEDRPESTMIKEMARCGYASAISNRVAGIHDRWQWNRDLYRKGYFFAHKHTDKLSHLVSYWRSMLDADPDFRIVMLGLADGIVGPNPTSDVNSFQEDVIRDRLGQAQFDEKDDISSSETRCLIEAAEWRCIEESNDDHWYTHPFPHGILDQWREFRRADCRSESAARLMQLYRRRGWTSLPKGIAASLGRGPY